MKQIQRRCAVFFVVALMLSMGWTLTLLGSAGLQSQWKTAVLVSVSICAFLSISSAKRWSWYAGFILLLITAVIALVLDHGSNLIELLNGIKLTALGYPSALSMISLKATVFLSAILTLIACVAVHAKGGTVIAAMGTICSILMLWLSNTLTMLPFCALSVSTSIYLAVLMVQQRVPFLRTTLYFLILCFFSFIAIPKSGVTVAPMKESADALRQRVLDYFFFTEPRNVFSLASEGFYPQGTNQLGGSAEPTNHPVMTVYASRNVYLRGSVRDEYTGRMWRDTTSDRRYLWAARRWRSIRDDVFDINLPESALRENSLLADVTVTVIIDSPNVSSLFVPQRVRNLNVGGNLVPYFNRASELFATRDQLSGDTYSVVAAIPLAGERGLDILIDACARTGANVVDTQVYDTYTTLPSHLQTMVYDLAQAITKGCMTPYTKALAIQEWLKSNCRYEMNVRPHSKEIDFVTSFLLDTREGYCVYFASAMTVLCRMVGIPARYVEGYLAKPGADDIAHVTGLDAHAWTEIYLSGFGWLTIDATPSREPQTQSNSETYQTQENTPEVTELPNETVITPTPPPRERMETEASVFTKEPIQADTSDIVEEEQMILSEWWLWLLIAIVLLFVLRCRWTKPENEASRSHDDLKRWDIWMQYLCDALYEAGLTRCRSETLTAWFSRVQKRYPQIETFDQLGKMNDAIFYGKRKPTHLDVVNAKTTAVAIVNHLSKAQRCRLMLRRAVLSASRRDWIK